MANKVNVLQEPFAGIAAAIKHAVNVVVTTHTNPDGDALGSSLALAGYLRKIGKEVLVIVPNSFPGFLEWMPEADSIIVYQKNPKSAARVISRADLIFCLDFNALNRLDKLQKPVMERKVPLVLIDHHIAPSNEFDLTYSDTQVSSTAELVYHFISAFGETELIDVDMATQLFVGIMTDTGSFSFSCNRPEVFAICASLIRLGVNPENVHRQVYDTYSESRMRLLGHGLSDRLKVFPDFAAAYIYLTREDLKRFQYSIGDTEGLVNYPLSIKGINMSVLFTEKHGHIRMSFRSKGTFSVNDFVRNHFEGGGHRNAAGGNSYISLKKTLEKFESLLPDYKDALINS
ncbi:MAG TPA: bifunctional oligoribonuclease/PAP phosphatase NrnA [Bacteroidales bacterium]|nr:bifunctional oligoribonuclease/PAP phosphatase NrnA [Bacteroidales bacterium]